MRKRSEAGDTLIEVLIATVIMAIAVVALMEGLATATSTSGFNRRLTEVQTVLGSAGAALTDPGRNSWSRCAITGSYSPTSGVTLPAGWTASNVKITKVQYFYLNSGSPAWGPTCTFPYTLQMITVLVIAPPGNTSVTVCPTTSACQTRSFVKGPQE
jgi:Tfp pilus assembly protein PilV